MKNYAIVFLLLNTFFVFRGKAQDASDTNIVMVPCDTITQASNFKYKIGIKIISEQSADYSIRQFPNEVFSSGIQVVRAIGNTHSSIESGLYLITKANEYDYITYYTYWDPVEQSFATEEQDIPIPIHYYNLSIPVNYRYDFKFVYLSAGIMIDYLVGQKVLKNEAYLDSVGYKPEEMRKLNYGYNLTLGGERCLSTRIRIYAEIRFSETLSSAKITDGNAFINPSYSNWGIAIGASYKLY